MNLADRDRLTRAEAEIKGLGSKLDDFKEDLDKRLDKQDAALSRLTTFMDRHQGGVAAIIVLGSLSGLVASAVAWVGAKATGILK